MLRISHLICALCVPLSCTLALRVPPPNFNNSGTVGKSLIGVNNTFTRATKEMVDKLISDMEKTYAKYGHQFSSKVQHHHKGMTLEKDFGTTGGSIMPCDFELMLDLKSRIRPTHIFGVGNAFGLSTLALATVFPEAAVDVIDAEIEGASNEKGVDLTRRIAHDQGLNVSITKGFSPQDTEKALRGDTYQLVLIDGKHTKKNMLNDYKGIKRHLTESSVVLFHDVASAHLLPAVKKLLKSNSGYHHLQYKGLYENPGGTGIFISGKQYNKFADLGEEVSL
eukprot:gnl/TRDRNA2_/TRDRNA2_199378_c0_seq1.p1 gnl/TRDRNA2_/TRDRNA2_199378_c0~~gnl/TRDRNA2_/TRDRNA2_199378_c0_seq1.p1  ORF type:complete len:280 (-),score=33.62 gnl/TRDRNA2_/TRDRNA2_199378_c0_seq1:56-895(-)